MSIQVILADDHQIVRNGIAALLALEPDIEVVAEASDGWAAIDLVKTHTPDVAVIDITMPGLNGILLTRQLSAETPTTKVVALSMHSEPMYVRKMFSAGAAAYVTKSSATRDLVEAIRQVTAGRTYLSPAVTGVVVGQMLNTASAEAESPLAALTDRQLQVLQLIAEGLNSKMIAQRLGVSVRTADAHRQQIMNKLDLHSVAELTRFAIRHGLTPLDT